MWNLRTALRLDRFYFTVHFCPSEACVPNES
jgi:hypothetical protein